MEQLILGVYHVSADYADQFPTHVIRDQILLNFCQAATSSRAHFPTLCCWRSATLLLLLLQSKDVQYSIRTLAGCQAGCVDQVMAYRPKVDIRTLIDNDCRIEHLVIHHNRFEDSYRAISSAEALKNRHSV